MEFVTMKRIQILLAFLFTCINCIEVHNEPDLEDANIINHNRTSIKDYPYFALLVGCSAAILSDRWAITVAHCVHDPKLLSVNRNHFTLPGSRQWPNGTLITLCRISEWNYYGSFIENQDKRLWVGGESIRTSQQINFNKIVIHPQFKYLNQIPLNDIALLQLTEPLKFTDEIKPVKLSADIQKPYSELILVGKQKYDGNVQSKTIDSLELIRLSPWECLKYIPKVYHKYITPYLNTFEKINVCTKSRNDALPICLDESGSLLLQDHQLIGLVSYGADRNCQNNRLMFFTNVPNYVQWVKSVTGLK